MQNSELCKGKLLVDTFMSLDSRRPGKSFWWVQRLRTHGLLSHLQHPASVDEETHEGLLRAEWCALDPAPAPEAVDMLCVLSIPPLSLRLWCASPQWGCKASTIMSQKA